jgi:hypothetical protein
VAPGVDVPRFHPPGYLDRLLGPRLPRGPIARADAVMKVSSPVVIAIVRSREIYAAGVDRADARALEDCGKIVRYFRILVHVMAEREGFEPPIRLPVFRISSAARSTTLPPLRGRKGQQARSVGRYVSNAAGRNKGGAPIEIDELIKEWRRWAA